MGFNLPLTKVIATIFCRQNMTMFLTIETKIDYIKRASIKFNSYIWDEERKNLLVEGYTIHACTNSEGKIRRIPQQILDLLTKYNIKGE